MGERLKKTHLRYATAVDDVVLFSAFVSTAYILCQHKVPLNL